MQNFCQELTGIFLASLELKIMLQSLAFPLTILSKTNRWCQGFVLNVLTLRFIFSLLHGASDGGENITDLSFHCSINNPPRTQVLASWEVINLLPCQWFAPQKAHQNLAVRLHSQREEWWILISCLFNYCVMRSAATRNTRQITLGGFLCPHMFTVEVKKKTPLMVLQQGAHHLQRAPSLANQIRKEWIWIWSM